MTNDEYKRWQSGTTARQPTKDRGYDRWHVRDRLSQLGKFPFCQINKSENCTKEYPALATELDHIIPIRVRPELAHEGSNHQSACKPCNAAKKHRDARTWPVSYSKRK